MEAMKIVELRQLCKDYEIYKGVSRYTKPQLIQHIKDYQNKQQQKQQLPIIDAVNEKINYEMSYEIECEISTEDTEDDITEICDIDIKFVQFTKDILNIFNDVQNEAIELNQEFICGRKKIKTKIKQQQKNKLAKQRQVQKNKELLEKAGIDFTHEQRGKLSVFNIDMNIKKELAKINNKYNSFHQGQEADVVSATYDQINDLQKQLKDKIYRFKNQINDINKFKNVSTLIQFKVGDRYITNPEDIDGLWDYDTKPKIQGNILIQKSKGIIEGVRLQIVYLLTDELSIGMSNKENIESQNYYIINPRTKHLCVFHCIAIWQLLKDETKKINYLSYVKDQAKLLGKKYDIDDKGCTKELFIKLSEEYGFEYIENVMDKKDIKSDNYLIINDSHCLIACKKSEHSKDIYEDIKFNHQQQQKPMQKKLQPKKQIKKVYDFLTFDFEWFRKYIQGRDDYEQVPYNFGIYHPIDYKSYNRTNDFYEKFGGELIDICRQIKQQFEMQFEEQKKQNKKIKKPELIIKCFAHSNFKADFPIIQKMLYNSKRFSQSGQPCKTKMGMISITFLIKELNQKIMFVDSINHMKMCLDEMPKQFGLEVTKGDVNHEIINEDNYIEQQELQNIDDYQYRDCKVLYDAIQKYREIVLMEEQIDIIQDNINTTASLGQNILFKNNYNPDDIPIYTMTSDMQDFCQQSYKGGMNDVLSQGVYENVMSLDYNSSYPSEMMKDMPVGSYHWVNISSHYAGQKLQDGIYRVNIISTPEILYPVLCDQIDGKLTFAKFKNHTLNATLPEIIEAYKRGYQMYIINGIVSEQMRPVFKNFIEKMYNKRKCVKKQMKIVNKYIDDENCEEMIKQEFSKLQGDKDWIYDIVDYRKSSLQSQYIKLDNIQALCKLCMNSVYGKFGWAEFHEVANQITNDEMKILQLMSDGLLTKIDNLNDANGQYMIYSADEQSSTDYTNFMIASYITANARLHLIRDLYTIKESGNTPLYVDTDSIYFQLNTSKEQFMEKCGHLLDDDILGMGKLEMKDNVNEEFAQGVFISCKQYALKGMEYGKTKIHCKGLDKWTYENDEKSKQRRINNNVKQITYQDMIDCYNGKNIVYQKYQQSKYNKLLSNEYECENIKRERIQEKQIGNRFDKRIILDNGLCKPKRYNGEQELEIVSKKQGYQIFGSFEDIEQEYEQNINEVLLSNYIVRDNQCKFIVFEQRECMEQYLKQKNNKHDHHQVYGKYMMPTIDIDCRKNEMYEELDLNIDIAKKEFAKILNIPEFKLQVINRCREDKISYHIIAPEYIIDKEVLKYHIFELVQSHSVKDNLIQFIDINIYSYNKTFRISNNNYLFNIAGKQIDLYVPKKLQIKINNKTKKSQNIDNDNINKQVNEYLVNNNLDKLWKIRCVKQKQSIYIVSLNRINKQATKHCKFCNKIHDNDNYLYLKIKNNKISEHCLKMK